MERLFRAPDVVPQDYVSEAIAEALPDVRGLRFLLARADIARRDLAHILRDRGAIVDEVTAYRIVPAEGSINLPSSAPDFITLTSAASARAAFEQLKSKGFEQWMRESSLVTIGPITSAAVRELGLTVAIEADEFTVPGMIAAIVERTEGQAVHA
jgi:uroporphyrinogen-III synthase